MSRNKFEVSDALCKRFAAWVINEQGGMPPSYSEILAFLRGERMYAPVTSVRDLVSGLADIGHTGLALAVAHAGLMELSHMSQQHEGIKRALYPFIEDSVREIAQEELATRREGDAS